MKSMRHTLSVWIFPVVAAALTLTILNALERSIGFGVASVAGILILLFVVILFWSGRKQR